MSHLLLHLHLQLVTATTPTTKPKSSSSSSSSIFLVAIIAFAAVYFLFIRPRSKRARAGATTTSTLSIGDEVISAGGILGVVRNVVGDEIEVEVAPGISLMFWRRAVNLRTAVRGAPQSSSLDDEPVDDAPAGGHDGSAFDGYELGGSGDGDPGPPDETGTVDGSHGEHLPDDPTRHGEGGGGR